MKLCTEFYRRPAIIPKPLNSLSHVNLGRTVQRCRLLLSVSDRNASSQPFSS